MFLGGVCAVVGESGAALGRWWSERCTRYAWYSSGELTSAVMYSSFQQTSLRVHPCIMNGCRNSKNKTKAILSPQFHSHFPSLTVQLGKNWHIMAKFTLNVDVGLETGAYSRSVSWRIWRVAQGQSTKFTVYCEKKTHKPTLSHEILAKSKNLRKWAAAQSRSFTGWERSLTLLFSSHCISCLKL